MSKEYASPEKTIITTSRNPTQQIRTFCNDLATTIPNTQRINRGKANLTTLAEKTLLHQAQKLIIADRWKGSLGRIQLYTFSEVGLAPYYPIIYVRNLKLRKDFGHKTGKKPKTLTIQTDTHNPEAQKLAGALADFLNAPKQVPEEQADTQIIMHIKLDNRKRIQITFLQTPKNIETGPRIAISHLIWKPPK